MVIKYIRTGKKSFIIRLVGRGYREFDSYELLKLWFEDPARSFTTQVYEQHILQFAKTCQTLSVAEGHITV